jgi:hypothetical protein
VLEERLRLTRDITEAYRCWTADRRGIAIRGLLGADGSHSQSLLHPLIRLPSSRSSSRQIRSACIVRRIITDHRKQLCVKQRSGPAGIDPTNTIMVYNNEQRKKPTVQKMLSAAKSGFRVCVWSEHTKQKEINEMILITLKTKTHETQNKESKKRHKENNHPYHTVFRTLLRTKQIGFLSGLALLLCT